MVTIKDGCGCGTASCCSWKDKLEEAYKRATASVNKIGDNDGSVYFPDGTGFVKLPLPRQSDVAQIKTNTQDIADLKVRDTQLQANINAEASARETAINAEASARETKDTELDAAIARIDNTDTAQDQRIQDNTDKITSTYNDLVATEATVATHDSDIITLKSQTVALGKSLVSDVIMTDGTTAGSVQVSIEREDGALITSANYKWGRDIGVRLEAGTQAGYIKTVIDLSDGTTLTSNEYKIVEVLESDVYVTAITLVPDMTAGTIGGNISYSNGTTQTINAVNVPTAPGVTSAIEALQSRMTAVENTNNTQSSEITALTNRVQAIEDTPGVGQFGAGKLGTIAGSAADGRVKAEDDGTGSVNGWSALKQRVTTAEGQIVSAQNDISALDGTVAQQTTDISKLKTDVTNIQNKDTAQDTAIAGKVAIDQGAANAGKALIVGENGNVTPVALSIGATKITGLLESYYKEGTAPSWSNVSLNGYSIPHTTQSYIVVSPDGNNVYAVTKTDRTTSSTSRTVDVLLQTDKDAYYQEIIKQTFRISDFSELSNGSYSVEILFRSSTEYCVPLTITFTITNSALASFTSPINYPYVNSFNNSTKKYYVYWWIGAISITE